MAYQTTKEILDTVQSFHHRLAELYNDLCDQTDQMKVKSLLTYLEQHEHRLEACIAAYTEDVERGLSDTWFKYTPPGLNSDDISAEGHLDSLDLDSIIQLAIDYDERVIAAYKQLVAEAQTDRVRRLFQSLQQIEEREERRLLRNACGI